MNLDALASLSPLAVVSPRSIVSPLAILAPLSCAFSYGSLDFVSVCV